MNKAIRSIMAFTLVIFLMWLQCVGAEENVLPALPDDTMVTQVHDTSAGNASTDASAADSITPTERKTANSSKNAVKSPSASTSATSATATTSSATSTTASEEVGIQAPTATVNVVEFGGAASVTIPIAVPPGRNNLIPSLSLSHVRGSNGWLGVGWSLDIGSIQRQTKFGVDYANSKFMAFKDGQAAELVARPSWGANYYGSKVESSFSKFYYDSSNNRWVVTFKSGTKFYYGSTEASRQTGKNTTDVFKWCLDRVQDSNGNYMRIEYFKDDANHEIYLSRIIYTNNVNDGLGTNDIPHGEIQFYLEERPDIYNYAIGNILAYVKYRLKTINVKTNGDKEVRAYKLSYEATPVTSASVLKTIKQFGTNAVVDASGNISSGSSLPPIVLSTNANDSLSLALAGARYHNYGPCDHGGTVCEEIPSKVYVGHFDNDRKTDYMLIDKLTNTRYVYLNNGDGTFREQKTSDGIAYAIYTFNQGDINGDGIEDYFYTGPLSKYIYVYLNNGDGTFKARQAVNLGQTFGTLYQLQPGDYNGDGKLDLMWIQPTTNLRSIFFADVSSSNVVSFTKPTSKTQTDKKNYYAYDFVPGDFNGDGKMDYMWLNPLNNQRDVYLNSGNEYADFQLVSSGDNIVYSSDSTKFQFLLADVNGDGKTDYIWSYPGQMGGVINPKYTYLSNGDGTFAERIFDLGDPDIIQAPNTSAGMSLYAGDFNGDGKADLFGVHTVTVTIIDPATYSASVSMSISYRLYAGTGDGKFVRDGGFQTGKNGASVVLGDFNGDGVDDPMVLAGSDQRITGGDLTMDVEVYAKTEAMPLYTLDKVENGKGGATQFAYRYSSEYQNTFLPWTFPVVETMTANDGNGNESTVTYNYAGGFFDHSTRTFRGFEAVSLTNTDNMTITNWYHQDEYFLGRLYLSTSMDSLDFTFSRADTYWTTADLENGAKFVKMHKSISESYDSGADAVVIQKEITYDDANGNILVSKVSGTDAEDITTTTAYINAAEWLWVPTTVTMTGSVSGKVRETYFTYYADGTGNLQSEEKWLDGGLNPKILFTYDAFGNRKTTTDPKGVVVSRIDYDLTTNTYPIKVTAAQTGSVTHVVKNAAINYGLGKATQTTDENGKITRSYYDVFGRLKQINSPDGGVVAYGYRTDVFPQYTVSKVKENTSGSYITAYVYYDGFGRPVKQVGYGENGKTIIAETEYDSLGRVSASYGPYYSGATQYPWVKTIYDSRGRTVKVESQTGQYGVVSSSIAYTGLTTTTTDLDGRKKSQTKDYLGRVIKITEYLGSTPINTIYAYNAAGDLLAVTDYYGSKIQIEYDTLGRKTKVVDPDRGTWCYAYDANSNMITQTDARGITLTFGYDDLNRVISRSYSTGKTSVLYTYDNLTITNGRGRLYSISNGSATKTVNDYDAIGRVLSSSKTIAGNSNTFTTQIGYDLAGRLANVIYPDNTSVGYNYYAGTSLIYNVVNLNTGEEYVRYSAYEPFGKIGQINHGNGAMTRYTYDVWSGRLTGLVSADPSNAAENDYQRKSYTYYKSGDIKTITDYKQNITFAYTYDTLHRLKTETNNGGLPAMTLSYNAVGNIVSKIVGGNTMTYIYDATKKHFVKKVTFNGTAYVFQYDANGNMTTGWDFTESGNIGKRTMSYDEDNNLIKVVYAKGGQTATATMIYDETGDRVKKTGSSVTYYIGDHFEVKGGVQVKHVTAGNQKLAVIQGNDIYYFHKDHLGSSAAISNSAGVLVETTDYMPFGAVRSFSGSAVTNYRYTGQELDPENGLYYYKSRYYDSVLARFISPDGIYPDLYDPQALNGYSYCDNNPLRYVDPNGHEALGIVAGIVIGAVIGIISAGVQSNWDVQAVVTGAVIGGIAGGVSGGVLSVAGDLIALAVEGTMLSGVLSTSIPFIGVTATDILAGAAAGAAGGMVSGGLGAAVSGGNIGDAILKGGALGAISGAAFGAIGVPSTWSKLPAYIATGGALALISDRNFIEGALIVGAMASIACFYSETLGAPLDGKTAGKAGDTGRGNSVTYHSENQQSTCPANTMGMNFTNAFIESHPILNFFVGESGFVMSNLGRYVPAANQWSAMHDISASWPAGIWGSVLSVPTIPFFMAAGHAGLTAYYAPISSGVWLGFDEGKK